MKILSISTLDIWPWGKDKGIPSLLASQKGFVERGHEVHFICPLKKRDLAQKEDCEGIHIFRFRLPFNLSTLKALSMPKGTFFNRICITIYYNLEWLFFQIYSLVWGIKLTRRIRPDLIYAHTLTSAFPAYLISRLFKTKLVVRVYGIRDLYWKWENLWFRFKEFKNYLAFKIPADYFIITDDGSCGNRLADNSGVPDKKIRYWRNGMDQGLYKQDPFAKEYICNYLKLNPSCKIIASTCRLITYYGVDEFLHSFADLHKKNSDAVCLIAGDGPEKKALEEFARKAGISSSVLFLGIVDRQMVKKILNAADVFVFLSRYHNGTNTMWEAMACGKCIVTTETEAIKDVLTSNVDAVLVHPEAFEKIPGILDSLLSDEQRRRRLGENARLRARQVLESWPQRIEKEAELLEDLVKESR